MASLKIFHANKIYDDGVHAVKDFCLDVNDKEFVVFVGPSGCGKSTALRMISGLEKITSGDVYIGDRLVNGLPPKERNIAMVFQSYALFPNMSVYDNISFGLRMHGEDKDVIKQKVTDAAELLGLTDYLSRKPSQLSGGQKQRVALGRAIVRNPDLFLLDEPLSNLDAKLRTKMRNEILALHRRLGATFVYVTHDQTEAMTMGDKIVVMNHGEVMQVGSPKQLYRYPANVFVAGFIGTPQMNFWNGEIVVNGNVSVKTSVGTFVLSDEQLLRLNADAKINGKKVVVGVRPENIFTRRKNDTDVKIQAQIATVEELCTHSVLHGEVGEQTIVSYGESEMDEVVGKDVALYVDTSKLHLFDYDTQQTVMPQYAAITTVKGTKNGHSISLLGGNVALSEQQAAAIEDGEIELSIPVEAVIDGDIPIECKRVLVTDNGAVSLVCAGGTELYAVGDWSSKHTIGLDLAKVDILGSTELKAISDTSVLEFSYVRCVDTTSEAHTVKHFCLFGRSDVEAYYEFNKKMYRLGKGVFKQKYRMYVSTDNVRLAAENEPYPTVQARVEKCLDYGSVQYSLVSIDGQSLYVKGSLPVGEVVTLALDLDNVRVSSSQNNVILF